MVNDRQNPNKLQLVVCTLSFVLLCDSLLQSDVFKDGLHFHIGSIQVFALQPSTQILFDGMLLQLKSARGFNLFFVMSKSNDSRMENDSKASIFKRLTL
jgi:hypothetical protein